MKEGLSEYKFKRIAEEALRNSLRLHFDSIILFKHSSYPSSYQLSILSLEEFAKAKWVDHYYYTSKTNEGFPDTEHEQEWLKLLYFHPEKQFAFIAREIFDYSPNFVHFVKNKKLEMKKQQSIYVGLQRNKNYINTDSRVSVPENKIKQNDAKKIISLINQEFLDIYDIIQKTGDYWGISDLNKTIDEDVRHEILFHWPYKSGLKSKKWNKIHYKT